MYTIDKDVPIPKDVRQAKYPFTQMAIGHSFSAPKEQANTIRAAAAYYRRRHKMKFVIRATDDSTVRVWRTE